MVDVDDLSSLQLHLFSSSSHTQLVALSCLSLTYDVRQIQIIPRTTF